MFCRSLFVLFFGHCVVCPFSIHWFWFPLWYLQTLFPTALFGLKQHYNLFLPPIKNYYLWISVLLYKYIHIWFLYLVHIHSYRTRDHSDDMCGDGVNICEYTSYLTRRFLIYNIRSDSHYRDDNHQIGNPEMSK